MAAEIKSFVVFARACEATFTISAEFGVGLGPLRILTAKTKLDRQAMSSWVIPSPRKELASVENPLPWPGFERSREERERTTPIPPPVFSP